MSLLECTSFSEVSLQGYTLEVEEILKQSELIVQQYTVDPTRDTILFGKEGTVVSIPQNSFEDSQGPVKIELIEALSLSDIILLNAQTVSRGELLQTDGVVYIQASSNGMQINLNEGQTIEIEIPTRDLDKDMLAFVGNYDDAGKMDWSEGNTLKLPSEDFVVEFNTDLFFTIPFELFPNRMKCQRMDSIANVYPITPEGIFAPLSEYLMGNPKRKMYKRILALFEDGSLIDTYIQTEQFANRLGALDGHYWIRYRQPDGINSGYKFIENKYEKVQLKILNIYIDNIDKPLYYSDSLVINEITNYKRNILVDSARQHYEKFARYFESFKAEGLHFPIKINDRGIDLSLTNAYQLLLQSGESRNSARKTLELFHCRERIIASLKIKKASERKSIVSLTQKEKEKEEAFKVAYYLIEVNQLGWINVDKYYNSPNAEEFNLLAYFSGTEELDFFNVSLVIPNQNAFLSGYKYDKGLYRFCKDEKYYSKLPIGEPAILMGISYKDGKPIMGYKEIIIGKNKLENLSAVEMDYEAFKMKMDKVN